MEIVNESNFSLTKLRKLIRFCRPPNIKIGKVIFRNSKKYFYGYFLKDTCEIVIGVGPSRLYPIVVNREPQDQKKGYASGFKLSSREEAAVYLLSHELRHLQQRLDIEFQRIGRKARYSEEDAEFFALKKLNNWKKKKRYERKYSNRGRECSNLSNSG